jgi:hypothetical protein
MTLLGTTRNHGVSQIHRPDTDHRSAFDPGSFTSEAPGCNRGLHHGGEYGNHRSCARDESIAGARRQHRSGDPGRCEVTPIPDEWSVDVQGPNIIVAFADGDETGRRILTRHQARVMREQLRLAYLLAGRNKLTRDASAVEVGAETSSVSALIGDELHPILVDVSDEDVAQRLTEHRERRRRRAHEDDDRSRLEAIERTAGALTGAFQSSEDATAPEDEDDAATNAVRIRNRLPERWDIQPVGDSIYFGVPASAADGEFLLNQGEALAVGLLLIQLSRRRWIYEDNEELLDVLRLQELRSQSFRAMTLQELLDALRRTEAESEPGDDGNDVQ